jgi:hypothetical protein
MEPRHAISVRPKIADLNFFLFGRSIHPELFETCAQRRIERDKYSVDINITNDGHLFVFRHNGLVLTEVSAGTLHPLPQKRRLMNHSIRTFQTDQLLFREAIHYCCEFQREKVAPQTVLAIQQGLSAEIVYEGLVHSFQSSGRMAFGAVSYIHVQSYQQHVRVRSFHTFPDSCTIIKSQSEFRCV